MQHARQNVAADVVRAQPVPCAHGSEAIVGGEFRRVERGQKGANQGDGDPESENSGADLAHQAQLEQWPRAGGFETDFLSGVVGVFDHGGFPRRLLGLSQARIGENGQHVGDEDERDVSGAEDHRAGLHQRHVAP